MGGINLKPEFIKIQPLQSELFKELDLGFTDQELKQAKAYRDYLSRSGDDPELLSFLNKALASKK